VGYTSSAIETLMPESLYAVLVGLVTLAVLNVRLVRQLRAAGRDRNEKAGRRWLPTEWRAVHEVV